MAVSPCCCPSMLTVRLLLGLVAVLALSAPAVAASTSVGAPSATPAAPGRVTGVVSDSTSGETLVGATIRIAGTSIGVATDIDGRFTISGVPAGPQTLTVSYIGYDARSVAVVVPDGGTVTVDVALAYTSSGLGEVTVTAQLEGQLEAINEQLNSNTISNVVSADRIRELPDANAAESIGRLPGVSLQRSSGEANKIVIRGLSPQFNTVTVNGVRVPSTDANDRSVDLTTISPEALAGIEVFKALPANFEADAIGGTVDLRLRTAPTGLHGSAQAQGGYNELQSSLGNYRFSGNVSNRFFGDRVGIIAGANVERVDRSADNLFGGFRLENRTDTAGLFTVVLAENLRIAETLETRNRYGGSLVADVRYGSGELTFNTFLSRLDADETYRQNFYNVANTSADFVIGQSSNQIDLGTGALNLVQRVGPLTFDATASYARSVNRSPDSRQFEFGSRDAFDPGFDRETSPFDSLQFYARDLLDRSVLGNIARSKRLTRETEATLRADVSYPFSLGSLVAGSLRVGGMVRDRDRSNDESRRADNLSFGGTQYLRTIIAAELPELFPGVAAPGALPLAAFIDDGYDPGTFLGGAFELENSSRLDLLNRLSDAVRDTLRFDALGSVARDYNGSEQYRAGFVMGELRIGRYVTFVPGLRYEHVDTEYTGYFLQDRGGIPTAADFVDADSTVARSNSYYFPQLLLTLRPTGWLDVRAARTRSLTRPTYNQLLPRQFVPQNGNFIERGNPFLEPAVSTNYDLAVALHTPYVGLFSVGYFSKNVEGFISGVNAYLLENCSIPGIARPCAIEGAIPFAQISLPVNNPFDARIEGVEFDLQTSLWYLPSFLRGIVVNANYTHLTSSTSYPFSLLRQEFVFEPAFRVISTQIDSSRVARLNDQPSDLLNLSLGYDLGGFSGRVSFQYTTDKLQGRNDSRPIGDSFTNDLLRIDFSAKQDVTEAFEIYLNLNNLTSAVDRSYLSTGLINPTFQEYYGLTGDLGLRYRF